MPQSLSRIYIHLVFSTKNRVPSIQKKDFNTIHSYLGGILNNIDCQVIRVGGTHDHIHLLFRLSRTKTISEVVRVLKSNSSHFIKTLGDDYKQFSWQDGYGSFSIGKSALNSAIRYIENQEEHHRIRNYQEELIEFLKIYDIDYDERYLWD